MDMSLNKPPKKKKIKNIDTNAFMTEVNENIKEIDMDPDLDVLVESYNNV